MKHYKTPPEDIVPIVQKIAFGAGNLVNNLLPAALGVFMYFLVTAFGMNPFLAGLLAAIPRFMDALTDPIMGYISDNTVSRWGRRKPYIFIGAILSGVLFMILWQLNPENSEMYNFYYFLIFALLFFIGNTIFSTPLIGLGYEMTTDYNERTRLMASSQIVGQLAWMIVPWFWYLIARPEIYPTEAEGVRSLSILVGATCIVLGILPAIFCREINQTNLESRSNLSFKELGSNLKSLIKGIKEISKNNPFMRLCGATFLVFNGFQTVASFSYFIIVYYMFKGSNADAGQWPAWFSTISAMVTAFLVIPIISWIASNWGKRRAFIIATFISIVGYIMKWWAFNPTNPWLILIPIPLMSFGIGGLFTLMMSMTADVCDLDELRNGIPRKEGTFGAVYWWMVKLGQALALAIGGAVLSLVGFNEEVAIQSVDTITKLRLADIIIPSVTALLAVWVMWNYNITEERAREIKKQLEEKRLSYNLKPKKDVN